MSTPLRVTILHTIAGGGHVSAARAIAEALNARYGDKVVCELVDALKDYAPKPLDLAPEAYSQVIKAPLLYKGVYDMGDGRRRVKMLTTTISRYARGRVDKMLADRKPDVVISTYHFANAPVLDALERAGNQAPFISVVTDLVTVPPIWFDVRPTLHVLPTETAFHQCLMAGLPVERLKRIGLPVSPKFVPGGDKAVLRKQLGWPANRPILLIMAGANGVGPLGPMAKAVIESSDVMPVIVTGKNKRLAARLREEAWANNAMIYDYVDNIATFMQAADVLATKAGSVTVTEALNVGIPMLFYARIPGQEEGNVEYVANVGAGYWTPKADQLVTTLKYLTSDPAALLAATAAAKSLARPKAAGTIAKLVYGLAK